MIVLAAATAWNGPAHAETAFEKYLRRTYPAGYRLFKSLHPRYLAARTAFDAARSQWQKQKRSPVVETRYLLARRTWWRTLVEYDERWVIHWLTFNVDRQQKAIAHYQEKIAEHQARIRKLETGRKKPFDPSRDSLGRLVRKSYQSLYPSWEKMARGLHEATVGLWSAQVARERWLVRWSGEVIENAKTSIARWRTQITQAKRQVASTKRELARDPRGAAAERGARRSPAVAHPRGPGRGAPIAARPPILRPARPRGPGRSGPVVAKPPIVRLARPRAEGIAPRVVLVPRQEGIVARPRTVSQPPREKPTLRIAGAKPPLGGRPATGLVMRRFRTPASTRLARSGARRSSARARAMTRTARAPATGIGATGRVATGSVPGSCKQSGPWACRHATILRFEATPKRVRAGETVKLVFDARNHTRSIVEARDPSGRILRTLYRKMGLSGGLQRGVTVLDRPDRRTRYRLHIWSPADPKKVVMADRMVEVRPRGTAGDAATSSGDIRVRLQRLVLVGLVGKKPRARGVSAEAFNPQRSPCTRDPDCNNQGYSGVCVARRCRSVARGRCTAVGKVRYCLDPFTGRVGAQRCRADGVTSLSWSDCLPRRDIDTRFLK